MCPRCGDALVRSRGVRTFDVGRAIADLERVDGARCLSSRVLKDRDGLAELVAEHGRESLTTVRHVLRRAMVTGRYPGSIRDWRHFVPIIVREKDLERAEELKAREVARQAQAETAKRKDIKKAIQAVAEEAKRPGEKACDACQVMRPLAAFPRHGATKDGRRKTCRACVAAMQAAKTTDEPRVIVRLANNRHNVSKWKNRNPEKLRAQKLVREAIRTGRLKRPDRCSVRGCKLGGRIEGHHPDYSEPLKVRWFCRRHHVREHQRMRECQQSSSSQSRAAIHGRHESSAPPASNSAAAAPPCTAERLRSVLASVKFGNA